MQICVFCITSAKILIFYINWLCFLLLSLIALCFGVFPSDTMISNAFSVHLLKFIYDTHSSISPSFLRKLLLARRTWISYSHPHTFSETVSLASFWVLRLSNTWFLESERSSFQIIKVVLLEVGKTAVLASCDWEFSAEDFIIFSHEWLWPIHVLF